MAEANPLQKSIEEAEELLQKTLLVAKGQSPTGAGIDMRYMETFAKIAERVDRQQRWKLSRYPFQAGDAAFAFIGGFFDNEEWPLRRKLAKQQSMFATAEHEAKYVNAAGYWSMLAETAMVMRQEAFKNPADIEEAPRFDAWAYIANRYSLRVLGLRTEFYRMASKDPHHAKVVLPILEQRGDLAMADNLDEALATLDSHMSTQLFKAAATLKASTTMKKAKGKGGAADDH